jgi:stage III sporulation protein AA
VDERSEIAACYEGVPQNNIGMRTDVMDACPKAYGILMLIRSMGPKVIAVDEIGKKEDVRAIEYSINCGCKIIATIHGESFDELKKKAVLASLLENKIFERYIVMSNLPKMGTIREIYNGEGTLIWNIPTK